MECWYLEIVMSIESLSGRKWSSSELFVQWEDSALWISLSMGERNRTFLPLPLEIEIRSIEENQFLFFFFFLFHKENLLYQTTKQWAVWKIRTIFLSIVVSCCHTNAPWRLQPFHEEVKISKKGAKRGCHEIPIRNLFVLGVESLYLDQLFCDLSIYYLSLFQILIAVAKKLKKVRKNFFKMEGVKEEI